ncbi:MAG TPA: hypothetical protein VD907_06550 [Verrucomicrobiae bacterium]|nr:hypothetical protein [Verrucomicrobiae bacterium]
MTDITSVEQLAKYRGEVIKYSEDRGKTWTYGRVRDDSRPVPFQEGGVGYVINSEVSPQGVHRTLGITDKRLASGLIVQPTTDEEIKGRRFSYE